MTYMVLALTVSEFRFHISSLLREDQDQHWANSRRLNSADVRTSTDRYIFFNIPAQLRARRDYELLCVGRFYDLPGTVLAEIKALYWMSRL